MHFETVNCPQCGGPLEGVAEAGFYCCPYCRSHIRVSFSNQDPDRRPDGRLTVWDQQTGDPLCYILLPAGWSAEGALLPYLQSANWPMTLQVQARPAQDPVRINYWSGSAFKEVRSGMVRHREGAFDQVDMMPMKGLTSPSQYADAFFMDQAGSFQNIWLHDSRPLPQEPPLDYASRAGEMARTISQQIQAQTPPGMWSRVDQAFYDGVTRIYDYQQEGQDWRMAVAVLIDGIEISGGAGGFFFGASMTYIIWESQYLLSLTSPRDLFDDYYGAFIMFASTMQASPQVFQRMERERTRISGQLQAAQSDWFNAHMDMMRQQQASFDAYNQAWFARSDSQHKAMRQASASQGSAMDRIFDKYSEAVRGVDTYIRPDGTEVEYSVINEAAFASATDSRTTFATQARDFRSIDWVKMKKKY